MTTLDWSVDRRGDVTLVAATIRRESNSGPVGDSIDVTVASRLDGAVWPPRSAGVPEQGWEGRQFETTVPDDGAVAVGFASPAEPVEPPIEIVEQGVSGNREDDPDAADVLRALGDPAPPRDAVPALAEPTGATVAPEAEPQADQSVPETRSEDSPPFDCLSDDPVAESERTLPAAVREWFEAVEARIHGADDCASSPVEATAREDSLAPSDDEIVRLRAIERRAGELIDLAVTVTDDADGPER